MKDRDKGILNQRPVILRVHYNVDGILECSIINRSIREFDNENYKTIFSVISDDILWILFDAKHISIDAFKMNTYKCLTFTSRSWRTSSAFETVVWGVDCCFACCTCCSSVLNQTQVWFHICFKQLNKCFQQNHCENNINFIQQTTVL